jgi:hypothetical protein
MKNCAELKNKIWCNLHWQTLQTNFNWMFLSLPTLWNWGGLGWIGNRTRITEPSDFRI